MAQRPEQRPASAEAALALVEPDPSPRAIRPAARTGPRATRPAAHTGSRARPQPPRAARPAPPYRRYAARRRPTRSRALLLAPVLVALVLALVAVGPAGGSSGARGHARRAGHLRTGDRTPGLPAAPGPGASLAGRLTYLSTVIARSRR
jgi:hypothetical protein